MKIEKIAHPSDDCRLKNMPSNKIIGNQLLSDVGKYDNINPINNAAYDFSLNKNIAPNGSRTKGDKNPTYLMSKSSITKRQSITKRYFGPILSLCLFEKIKKMDFSIVITK